MCKLEKLLAEKCPNGVEYKKIGEICNITRGKVMSKGYIKENIGDYPVYSSQTENNGELGKISTYNFDGEYLTWTTDGANAGSVFYRNEKFSITNVCGLLKVTNKNVLTKFLYYILLVEAPKYVNLGMGNPKLMSNVISKIKVPIPPIEVQHEIICILDKFTSSIKELKLELLHELQARQKQYEYYRSQLFEFNEEVPRKTFEEICNFSSGGDINKENVRKEETKEYNVPIYSNGIGKNALYGYTNKAKIMAPCITISARGTIGYCELRKLDFYPIVRLICAKPNSKEINIKFLKYYIETIKFEIPTSGIPQLTIPMIKSYKVPIPTIEEQERIVKILDKFQQLYNDVSEELVEEIDARQKQYEFYREKLLDFNEIK